MDAICVFCGSSIGNDPDTVTKGYELGKHMAQHNIDLVYGAAKIGIMGKVAEGALNHNGNVIGIIPEFLKKKEVVHLGLTELITTSNMLEPVGIAY